MICNCANCGNLFNKLNYDLCPRCVKEREKLLSILREYLKENKLATVVDVVHDTEAPLETILDFIDNGLLILIDNPNISVNCSHCGIITQDGRLCHSCRANMVTELANATQLIKNMKQTMLQQQNKIHYHAH